MKKSKLLLAMLIVSLLFIFSCSEDNTSSDNEPPTVAITNPADNSEFVLGEMISITADATDNEEIKEVRFYINGDFVSLDEEEPYEYEWDTGNTRDADHSIYAKAYDTNDNTKTSEVITITLLEEVAIPTDYVAYYPFNGNANDESGNDHNGNPELSVDFSAVDRFGNNNSAIYIGSSSSYITVPESEDLNLQSHSIVAWVKRELGHNTDGSGGVFGNGYSVDHYALVACESDIKSWLNYPSGPNDGKHLYETDALADEEFHHITITYDLNLRTIWLDGVLVSELDCSDPINYSSSDNCYIAMDFPGGNDWFAGVIDDIRIFNRALTADEIDALYHEGGWGE